MIPGGFAFTIDGIEFMFDFESFYCTPVKDGFEYESCWYTIKDFVDFNLDNGINTNFTDIDKSISAEWLASTTNINEFYINFITDNDKEIGFGDNTQNDDYRINISNIEFIDNDSGEEKVYSVNIETLRLFNSKF